MKMDMENKENQESKTPKEIALRLRQQNDVVVSPIDLSLKNAKTLRAEPLQWLNFYEPPSKLTLTNTGDAVMIRGKWSNSLQRPTLYGGPLDGHYIFSQTHFHWDSTSHTHATHTIDGKGNTMEMHTLFYKSTYHDQAEAQEMEDGIVIVVYFFKVDQRSSFKWVTDQLDNVTTPKASCQLLPAPLSALMTPFAKDYLSYWGSLACTCHHVLWLISQTPLRITEQELKQFGKIKISSKEKLNENSNGSAKRAHNLYRINSSNCNTDVLFTDATDPPCQITITPNEISIDVDYLQIRKINKIANKPSGDNQDISPSLCFENFSIQRKCSLALDSLKKTNVQNSTEYICSVCQKTVLDVNGTNQCDGKFRRKQFVASKINSLESNKIAKLTKKKILEKEKKGIQFWKRENRLTRRLLKKEREEIKFMKKVLDDELKRLAERSQKKEPPNAANEDDSAPKRVRSPIQKSVHTSKTIMGVKIDSHGETEITETKVEAISSNLSDSPENVRSEGNGDQCSVKEGRGTKSKGSRSSIPVRTPSTTTSKTPSMTTSTTPSVKMQKEKLQSSLITVFSGAPRTKLRSESVSSGKPDSQPSNKLPRSTPKQSSYSLTEKQQPRQPQDGGKGDQNTHNTRETLHRP